MTVVRPKVDRPNPIRQETDVIPEPTSIPHRMQDAIVSGQSADEETLHAQCSQVTIEGSVLERGIGFLVPVDCFIDDDG